MYEIADAVHRLNLVTGRIRVDYGVETAQHEIVLVRPGQVSVVLPGKAPVPASAIPMDVLLHIARLQQKTDCGRTAFVKGQTDVGARVFINNIATHTNDKGEFEQSVSLDSETRKIVVTAENVMGNARSKQFPVISDASIFSRNYVDKARVRWKKQSSVAKNRLARRIQKSYKKGQSKEDVVTSDDKRPLQRQAAVEEGSLGGELE